MAGCVLWVRVGRRFRKLLAKWAEEEKLANAIKSAMDEKDEQKLAAAIKSSEEADVSY